MHHLIKLMDAGLVVKDGRKYILREHNLQQVIKDIQRDMDVVFSELTGVAKEIDEKLG